MQRDTQVCGGDIHPSAGDLCLAGDTRGQHDACSASTGMHLSEGQKMYRNGPDYANDLVSHVVLAVTQWSLTEEKVHEGFCPC